MIDRFRLQLFESLIAASGQSLGKSIIVMGVICFASAILLFPIVKRSAPRWLQLAIVWIAAFLWLIVYFDEGLYWIGSIWIFSDSYMQAALFAYLVCWPVLSGYLALRFSLDGHTPPRTGLLRFFTAAIGWMPLVLGVYRIYLT
jgi:hypothetical protein